MVQVCYRVPQSDVNTSANLQSSLQAAAAGGKQMQKFSTFSSRMKTRILCCLMPVASQSLQAAAIVQQLQALPPCKAQVNQEHPQQVQPPLCAAAGPPGMPLLHQATVQSW